MAEANGEEHDDFISSLIINQMEEAKREVKVIRRRDINHVVKIKKRRRRMTLPFSLKH